MEKPAAELLVLRRLRRFEKLPRSGGQVLHQLSDHHLLLSGPGQAVVHGNIDWHAHILLLEVGQTAGGGNSGQSQHQQEEEFEQEADERSSRFRRRLLDDFFIC